MHKPAVRISFGIIDADIGDINALFYLKFAKFHAKNYFLTMLDIL